MKTDKGAKRNRWLVLLTTVLLVGMLFSLPGEIKQVQAGAGSYSLKFSAARTTVYIPSLPYPDTVTAPVGRGDGNLEIPNADFDDKVQSINPYGVSLCQVVPFEIGITVGAGAIPADQPITIVAGWNTVTTSGHAFGYDPDYGVIGAFIDYSDPRHIDTSENATVSGYSWSHDLPNNEIIGTIQVTGLETGDFVILEVWLVLQCTMPDKATGNVQSRLIEAYIATGPKITTGNQTIPLMSVSNITGTDIDLGVVKSDGDYDIWNPYLAPGGSFDYTIVVTQHESKNAPTANGVVMTDNLDPNIRPDTSCNDPTTSAIEICTTWTTAVRELNGLGPYPVLPCTWDGGIGGYGGIITCDLRGVAYGDPQTIIMPVTASMTVPTDGLIEFGTCYFPVGSERGMQGTDYVDICNLVSVTSISPDTNLANNADSEPKDVGFPTAVTLLGEFTATPLVRAVQLNWETATETNNVGFRIHRDDQISGTNKEPIKFVPSAFPGGMVGAAYQYIDENLELMRYYYWLEALDYDGSTQFYGPVQVMPLDRAVSIYNIWIPLIATNE